MLLFTLACAGPAQDTGDDVPKGLSLFGNQSHSLDAVDLGLVADAADGLGQPRDLAFHPSADELWIVNRATDGVTIVYAPGTSEQWSESIRGSSHFLAQPSALAFTDTGDWASIHEEDQKTQGAGGTPADFMGPTLWTGESSVFDGQHESHLDMMHNSPNGVGIAWERENTFWVVDGFHGALTRYAFNEDHDLGGTDHRDGELERWIEGEVGYLEDVSSHAVYDHDNERVLVADAANGRVLTLDPSTGSVGGPIGPNYDGAAYSSIEGGEFWSLIPEGSGGLAVPSGLAVRDGVIYVGDNATGNLLAYDAEGALLDWVPTGLSDLQGIAFDSNGDLWMVDASADEVWRLSN